MKMRKRRVIMMHEELSEEVRSLIGSEIAWDAKKACLSSLGVKRC